MEEPINPSSVELQFPYCVNCIKKCDCRHCSHCRSEFVLFSVILPEGISLGDMYNKVLGGFIAIASEAQKKELNVDELALCKKCFMILKNIVGDKTEYVTQCKNQALVSVFKLEAAMSGLNQNLRRELIRESGIDNVQIPTSSTVNADTEAGVAVPYPAEAYDVIQLTAGALDTTNNNDNNIVVLNNNDNNVALLNNNEDVSIDEGNPSMIAQFETMYLDCFECEVSSLSDLGMNLNTTSFETEIEPTTEESSVGESDIEIIEISDDDEQESVESMAPPSGPESLEIQPPQQNSDVESEDAQQGNPNNGFDNDSMITIIDHPALSVFVYSTNSTPPPYGDYPNSSSETNVEETEVKELDVVTGVTAVSALVDSLEPNESPRTPGTSVLPSHNGAIDTKDDSLTNECTLPTTTTLQVYDDLIRENAVSGQFVVDPMTQVVNTEVESESMYVVDVDHSYAYQPNSPSVEPSGTGDSEMGRDREEADNSSMVVSSSATVFDDHEIVNEVEVIAVEPIDSAGPSGENDSILRNALEHGREETPVDNQEIPVDNQETPVDNQETPVVNQETPVDNQPQPERRARKSVRARRRTKRYSSGSDNYKKVELQLAVVTDPEISTPAANPENFLVAIVSERHSPSSEVVIASTSMCSGSPSKASSGTKRSRSSKPEASRVVASTSGSKREAPSSGALDSSSEQALPTSSGTRRSRSRRASTSPAITRSRSDSKPSSSTKKSRSRRASTSPDTTASRSDSKPSSSAKTSRSRRASTSSATKRSPSNSKAPSPSANSRSRSRRRASTSPAATRSHSKPTSEPSSVVAPESGSKLAASSSSPGNTSSGSKRVSSAPASSSCNKRSRVSITASISKIARKIANEERNSAPAQTQNHGEVKSMVEDDKIDEFARTPNYTFTCNICLQKFPNEVDTRSHYLEVHEITKPFACKFCHFPFESRSEEEDHWEKYGGSCNEASFEQYSMMCL